MEYKFLSESLTIENRDFDIRTAVSFCGLRFYTEHDHTGYFHLSNQKKMKIKKLNSRIYILNKKIKSMEEFQDKRAIEIDKLHNTISGTLGTYTSLLLITLWGLYY